MSFLRNAAVAAFVLMSSGGMADRSAGQDAPAPAAPSLLDRAVNPMRVNSLNVYGPNQTHTTVPSTVQGGQAVRVVVTRPGTNPWDVTVAATSNRAVEQGDKLVVAAWLRGEPAASSAAAGRVTVRLQQTQAPYTGVATERLDLSADWTLYFVKGAAPQDFAPGALAAHVQLASQSQTIEVGPVFILAMGQDFDLSTIPANSP